MLYTFVNGDKNFIISPKTAECTVQVIPSDATFSITNYPSNVTLTGNKFSAPVQKAYVWQNTTGNGNIRFFATKNSSPSANQKAFSINNIDDNVCWKVDSLAEGTITAVSGNTITVSYNSKSDVFKKVTGSNSHFVGVSGYNVSATKAGYNNYSQAHSYNHYRDTNTIEMVPLRCTLIINPTPADASVTFSNYPAGSVINGKSITTDYNKTVSYTVSSTGYNTTTDSKTVTLAEETLPVPLIPINYTLTVNAVDANNTPIAGATVTFTEYPEGSVINGNKITAPYDGTVKYTVSKSGYSTITRETIIRGNSTDTVTLSLTKYTLTVNVTGANGTTLANAVVTFSNYPSGSTVNGNTIETYDGSNVTFIASCTNYITSNPQTTSVTSDKTVTVSLEEAVPSIDKPFVLYKKRYNSSNTKRVLEFYKVPIDGSQSDKMVSVDYDIISTTSANATYLEMSYYDRALKKILSVSTNNISGLYSTQNKIYYNTIYAGNFAKVHSKTYTFGNPSSTSSTKNLYSSTMTYNYQKHIHACSVYCAEENNVNTKLVLFNVQDGTIRVKTFAQRKSGLMYVIGTYWIESTNKLRVLFVNNGGTSGDQWLIAYDVNITSDESNVPEINSLYFTTGGNNVVWSYSDAWQPDYTVYIYRTNSSTTTTNKFNVYDYVNNAFGTGNKTETWVGTGFSGGCIAACKSNNAKYALAAVFDKLSFSKNYIQQFSGNGSTFTSTDLNLSFGTSQTSTTKVYPISQNMAMYIGDNGNSHVPVYSFLLVQDTGVTKLNMPTIWDFDGNAFSYSRSVDVKTSANYVVIGAHTSKSWLSSLSRYSTVYQLNQTSNAIKVDLLKNTRVLSSDTNFTGPNLVIE